ncbi:hypothetical protein A2U01_0061956, partial [Trifolium medium]|nr:hypothetical protein [Trifolium medium]
SPAGCGGAWRLDDRRAAAAETLTGHLISQIAPILAVRFTMYNPSQH